MARHDQRWTDRSLRCFLCKTQPALSAGVLCADCRRSATTKVAR